MNKLIMLILLVGMNAQAWTAKPKLPDATKEECQAKGMVFVKHTVTKNGVDRRAYCRSKAAPKASQK